MPNKTPATISTILVILLLILFAILSTLLEMVALNGASERQGTTAMIVSLVCQGVGVVLMGIFAGWLTRLMIAKFNWNKTLAVVIAVIAGIVAGGAISFLSIFIAIVVAGIR